MKLTICHLYPDLMNIYSDMGNIVCLQRRCQWRGIEAVIKSITVGQKMDWQKYDLFFGGGGQDRQQSIVSEDLQVKTKALKAAAYAGVPMLTTCGTYQLFGHYFKTHEGVKIPGIGIFDAYTVASHERKIGNIIIEINIDILRAEREVFPINENSSRLRSNNTLVGFENHSGNTYIVRRDKDTSEVARQRLDSSEVKEEGNTFPLGVVIKGFGNNGADGSEGAVYKNCLGTYLHGPVLPKNPHLADWLIKTALEKKYQRAIDLQPLDDTLEWQTHQIAIKRTHQTR